jgi:hypothetical protein
MKRTEVRPFTSKVGNITLTGTVSGKYKEISDYYVTVEVINSGYKYHFKFEMIMVAIPAMYVVNRVLLGALIDGDLPMPFQATQRMQAAQCFEHTLLRIVEMFKEIVSKEATTPEAIST